MEKSDKECFPFDQKFLFAFQTFLVAESKVQIFPSDLTKEKYWKYERMSVYDSKKYILIGCEKKWKIIWHF